MVMGELVAITGMLMSAFMVWAVVWYFTKRAQYRAQPEGDFRRLAEEAVRGQKQMAEEARRIADAVREMQQLLSKV